MAEAAAAPAGGDVRLWDGFVVYEGCVTRRDGSEFMAHVRESGAGENRPGTGSRIMSSFIEVQKGLMGRRFLAVFGSPGGGIVHWARIRNVQRSLAGEFEFFICGRYRPLEGSPQDALKELAAEGAGATFGS